MAAAQALIASLNAGEISRLALARIDLAKLRMACEQQQNWLPHVLGPTMVRPGTKYLAATASNAAGWLGEFYYDEATKALLVATANGLRFLLNDAYLTRGAVTAAVTNGTFGVDIASWTDSDEAGATSAWVTGGYMGLTGTGTNYAFRDQQITVTETGSEHALRVVVARNTIVLKVGTAQGAGDYLDVVLLPGTYSLAFTPTGDFWIRLGANSTYTALVDSIAVEGSGIVSLPVPWSTTAHFDSIRYDQSGDVLFVASAGFQQRRIERRSSDSRSWGIALYQADDGPFRLGNLSDITLTPGATSGSTNLTASRDFFKAGHVGALFKATHSAQTKSAALGALNAVTGEIRVAGVSGGGGLATQRAFAITVSGTFVATVTLQRSLGAVGSWTDVENYTSPVSISFEDHLDNQIVYYRLKCTAYTSGSADASLSYVGAAQTGICRVTGVSSGTVANIDVLEQFGDVAATSDWAESEWSDYRGWPGAVALHDGRLAWFPGIKAQLSVSDGFASYDSTVEGDAGPINRSIATGGLDGVRWALSLQRLIVGTAAQEVSIRASAFDEPLTPTQFVARICGRRGGVKVRPLDLGAIGVFAGMKRLFKLIFDASRADYVTRAFDRLKPEMFAAGIVDMAVQRRPDNAQIWVVLADGAAVVVTYDEDEDVAAMTPVTTDGSFERVACLPGSDEDDVYFIVARNVGGTVRYIEKLAKRSECQGATTSKNIDSHIVYSGAAVTTITGLSHLEGKQVVVWGDGAPRVTLDAPKTVSGGQITGLPAAISNAIVGLAYTAQLKTVKLAYAAEHGTAMTLKKRIARVGLVMADVAWKGVRIGRDFTNMTGLLATYRGKALTAGQVLSAYDGDAPVNSGWDSDARVCIQVSSPYPCTLMGLALHMTTHEPDNGAPGAAG